MKKPNLIEERDTRTVNRKLRKKEYDDLITLSASGDGKRLLDEGMVVDAYGYPLFYIMKGALEKYMDALTDDYVGSINLGHMEFANFPFILGTWMKKDLRLVDIGDGRKGLDVDIHLDQDSFIVKELKRANYDLGISAEFSFTRNEELSREYGLDIIEELFIKDFAIVGEAGNVNSSNIELGGNMTIQELMAQLNHAESKLDLKSLTAALTSLEEAAVETPEETPEETPVETPEEAPAETEETSEETTEETAEETEETSEEAPVEETPAESEETDLAAILRGLEETVNGLSAEIETLRSERDEARQALSVRENEEKEFIEKFKALSVLSTKEETPKPVERKPVYTDGIGE